MAYFIKILTHDVITSGTPFEVEGAHHDRSQITWVPPVLYSGHKIPYLFGCVVG
ncbi:hypothetical protein ES703_58950 [subsurface metagenome]